MKVVAVAALRRRQPAELRAPTSACGHIAVRQDLTDSTAHARRYAAFRRSDRHQVPQACHGAAHTCLKGVRNRYGEKLGMGRYVDDKRHSVRTIGYGSPGKGDEAADLQYVETASAAHVVLGDELVEHQDWTLA